MAKEQPHKLVVSGYPLINKQKIIDVKEDQTWLSDASEWVQFLDNPLYSEPPDGGEAMSGGNGNGGEHTREFVKSFDAFVPLHVPLVNTTFDRRPYVPVVGIKAESEPRLLLLTGFEHLVPDKNNPIDQLDTDEALELQRTNYGAYHWNCQWQYEREDSLQILGALRVAKLTAETSRKLPRSLRELWQYAELHATPDIAISEAQLQLACNNVCIVHVDHDQEDVFDLEAPASGGSSGDIDKYLADAKIVEDFDLRDRLLQAVDVVKHEDWEPSEELLDRVAAEVKEVVAAGKAHKQEVEGEKAAARKKGKAKQAKEKKKKDGKKRARARRRRRRRRPRPTRRPRSLLGRRGDDAQGDEQEEAQQGGAQRGEAGRARAQRE